jgi:hypothetical protein
MLFGFQDVDARDQRGHDESITQGRWYEQFRPRRIVIAHPAASWFETRGVAALLT